MGRRKRMSETLSRKSSAARNEVVEFVVYNDLSYLYYEDNVSQYLIVNMSHRGYVVAISSQYPLHKILPTHSTPPIPIPSPSHPHPILPPYLNPPYQTQTPPLSTRPPCPKLSSPQSPTSSCPHVFAPTRTLHRAQNHKSKSCVISISDACILVRLCRR